MAGATGRGEILAWKPVSIRFIRRERPLRCIRAKSRWNLHLVFSIAACAVAPCKNSGAKPVLMPCAGAMLLCGYGALQKDFERQSGAGGQLLAGVV